MAKIDMSADVGGAVAADARMKKKPKRNTKDLIQSGAFAAIYLVLMLLIVMGSSAVSPLIYLLAPLTVGVVTGTVYMLAVLKVQSIIPVIVMGGLFLLVAASSTPLSAALVAIWTAVACIILLIGKFKSKLVYGLSFVAFNMVMTAPFSILAYARDSFIQLAGSYYGETYAANLAALAPDWIFIGLVALALVGGIVGALIGNKLIAKHFKKAGLV